MAAGALVVSIIGLVSTVAVTAVTTTTGLLLTKQQKQDDANARLDNVRILYEIYNK